MNTIKYAMNEKLWLFISLGLVSFFMLLAMWANIDLSAGRFALFMDERITFDGVRHILHPDGFMDFILSVVDGGDHRYGRSLWNSIAIFSYFPERLFGETGQIIADRTAQVLFLVSAFMVLTITMLKHWFFRFLLLITLLTMPYTAYYMSMPKPEPLQMLFIAIFLFFFKRNEMALKGWYWIFLGLAFGTKISTLPAVLIFLGATFVQYWRLADYKQFAFELTAALGYFLLGLAIAVPILLPHLILSFLAFKLLNRFASNKFEDYQWSVGISLTTLLIISNFLASGLLALKYKLRIPLAVWFHSTFLSTSHGSDSSTITFASWVHFWFYDWLIAPITLTGITIALSLLVAFYAVGRGMKLSVFVIAAGLALNIAIFVAAHRLWGIYLFPGTILMAVGIFSLIEDNIFDYINPNDTIEKIDRHYYLSLLNLIFILSVTVFWWMPNSFIKYKDNANRTDQSDYINQYQSYINVTQFLTAYSEKNLKQIKVAYDPWLFIPTTTVKYQITEFWGPYIYWQDKTEVIVLSAERSKGKDMTVNSPEYRDFRLEREGYLKHVANADQQCAVAPCYVKRSTLPNGAEILTLSN